MSNTSIVYLVVFAFVISCFPLLDDFFIKKWCVCWVTCTEVCYFIFISIQNNSSSFLHHALEDSENKIWEKKSMIKNLEPHCHLLICGIKLSSSELDDWNRSECLMYISSALDQAGTFNNTKGSWQDIVGHHKQNQTNECRRHHKYLCRNL